MRELLYQSIFIGRIFIERLRVFWFILLGGNISKKCLFGARVRIDRPMAVDIGHRTILEESVWLKLCTDEARLNIGQHSFIGRGAEIDVSDRVVIGNHVLIAPGVFITDHAHNIKVGMTIDSQGCNAASVCFGDDAWLGVGSVVLPGVNIGKGAVVGAGTVVTRDVPDNTIVAGVPARVLRIRS